MEDTDSNDENRQQEYTMCITIFHALPRMDSEIVTSEMSCYFNSHSSLSSE